MSLPLPVGDDPSLPRLLPVMVMAAAPLKMILGGPRFQLRATARERRKFSGLESRP